MKLWGQGGDRLGAREQGEEGRPTGTRPSRGSGSSCASGLCDGRGGVPEGHLETARCPPGLGGHPSLPRPRPLRASCPPGETEPPPQMPGRRTRAPRPLGPLESRPGCGGS